MAGDWIKMEANTPEKEEVLAITSRMGWDDADLTVGKLFRLWRWFDQQTIDGNAARVTAALLDRIVGVTGFCEAVRDVGWLNITDAGISLPKFDRHNGATAKSRALTAKRVANHKANASGNATTNALSVSSTLPREEKRREEVNNLPAQTDGNLSPDPEAPAGKKRAVKKPAFDAVGYLTDRGVERQAAEDWMLLRKAKDLPPTITAFEQIANQGKQVGLDWPQIVVTCCHRGWGGFKASWYAKDEESGNGRQTMRPNDPFAGAI